MVWQPSPPPHRPTRRGVVPNLLDWLREREYEHPSETFADRDPGEQDYRDFERQDRDAER